MKSLIQSIILGLALMVSFTGIASAQTPNHPWGMDSMCGIGGMGGGWMMALGGIFWILLLVLMVLAIIWMAKQVRKT